MKIFSISGMNERLNSDAMRKPPSNGTTTPNAATIREAFPVFFSSFISTSVPALNIMIITPISARSWINSDSWITPRTAGPRIRPASNAPTTCGSWNFFVMTPRAFVLRRIIAKSTKKPISI